MSEAAWDFVTLGEITTKIGSGATPRGGSSVYVHTGTAFIRSQNVLDFDFSDSGLAFISDEAAEALKGVSVCEGDVLINITGDSVARVCAAPRIPARVSQHVAIVRADPRVADAKFIMYSLLNPTTKSRLLNTSSAGATRKALTKEHLRSLSILLPPLSEQRRIAGVLGALDDLIEVNRGLVADLDALRRVASASLLEQANTSVPLSSVARFVNGKNFTKEATGTGRPVIRTPELRQGPNGGTVWTDADAASDFIAKAGDVLFVWSGSLMVDRWTHEEGLVNQHIFKVIPQPGIPDWLVYAQIEHQMPWFLGLAADKATTMGHIQRGHLDADVPMPSEEALAQAAAAIAPLWDAALQLSLENLELQATRDELLPLLMSGRVRVAEVVAA